MNDNTKAAYRHLLYVAMLAIRNYCQSRGNPSYNLWKCYHQYRQSRIAGAIADWLHNLAVYSSQEFNQFDEQLFWYEHTHLCSRFPKERLDRYREIFDEYLKGRTFMC
jgi:hypothetical protein